MKPSFPVPDTEIIKISPAKLKISSWNVRKTEIKGPKSTWEEFVQDVKTNGIIHAPLATLEHEVIVGQRRTLAARQAGLDEIEVRQFKESLTEDMAISISLRENEHRDAIDPNDRLDALLALSRLYNKDKERIAKAVGRSTYTVTAWLSVSSTREEQPHLLDEGINKAIQMKQALETPNSPLKNATVEERTEFVEKASQLSEPQLRQVKRDAIAGRPLMVDPIASVSFGIKKGLLEWYEKKAKEVKISYFDFMTNILTTYAREHGWKA